MYGLLPSVQQEVSVFQQQIAYVYMYGNSNGDVHSSVVYMQQDTGSAWRAEGRRTS